MCFKNLPIEFDEGGNGKTYGETHEGRGRNRFEAGHNW